jgi:DNA-binding CsgD family transcriptional regulator
MSDGPQALTEKEKQTLRLIVRGHDAKSTARYLGLSVHTVNERLRDARRKMSVTSSREAARLLLDTEGDGPNFLTDTQLGDAEAAARMEQDAAPDTGKAAHRRRAWLIGGVLIMSLILATLALSSLSQVANQTAASLAAGRDAPAPSAPVADAAAVQSALTWLALVDDRRWDASWNTTGQAFKRLNTSQTWAAVSRQVREPLGTVASRTATSHESLPAPPHGYDVVKFRTSFAAKSDAVETVTLERESGGWKVVGYLIG